MGDILKIRLDKDRYIEVDSDNVSKFSIHVTVEAKKYYPGGGDKCLDDELGKLSKQCDSDGYDFLRLAQTAKDQEIDYYVASFGKRGTYAIKNVLDLPPEDNFRQWCFINDYSFIKKINTFWQTPQSEMRD